MQAHAAAKSEAAAIAKAAIRKVNSGATDIFISGIKGRHSVVNGLYSPTQEKAQDGRVVYRKNGNEALCIEHIEGRWRVKNQSDRGSVACFAHVEGCCALEDCRSRTWKVSDGRYFVDQRSVQMVTGEAAKSQAKAAAEAAAAIIKENAKAADIVISGFEGRNHVIDGLYSPTEETGQDGRVVYRKSGEIGDEALCIEHFEGRWCVKNQSDRGSVACFAHVEGGCALEDCRSRTWKVSDGEGFVDHPSVQMVTGDEAKSQAKAAVEAKTVAEAEAAASILKNKSKACPMVLSGVQGVNSVINGLYLPTQETGQDGRVVYRKSGESGDEALCIEHFEGRWCVKNQSDRGMGMCCAYVEGGCALEDCCSCIWKVVEGRDFVDQSSVQIVAVVEAV